MGSHVLQGWIGVGVVFVGAGFNFALATVFGAIFGFVVSTVRPRIRDDMKLQIAGGALYGLILWVINYEILGSLFFPWMVRAINPALQAAVHVLFYGVPLATWLSLRIRELEVPGVHELRHRYQTSTGAEQEFRIERDEEELGIRMPPPQLPPPERRPPAR